MWIWLEENKEWFLSGAGIFLITSIASFSSILLTLWFKSRSEKKRLKKLLILSSTTKLSAPIPDQFHEASFEDMKISYKGREYENLSVFAAQIKNIGISAIPHQKLHLTIPLDAQVIQVEEEKNLESININKEEIIGKSKKEIIYEIDRLESNDVFSILYLINAKNETEIQCEARGVDGIEYHHKDEFDRPEIEKLLIYVAAFIFLGMLPGLSNLFQAIIVLMASPLIINLYKNHINRKENSGNSVIVNGGIRVDESGEFAVHQISKET